MSSFIESLETRRLLSGTAIVSGHTLVVRGTAEADAIIVGHSIDDPEIIVNFDNQTNVAVSDVGITKLKIVAGAGGDSIIIDSVLALPAFVLGQGGNDTIEGGSKNDVILGGEGNDSISGNGGADSISGEAGKDTLLGGDGNDTLLGGAGNDRLSGGDGDDRVHGGANDDVLSGNAGTDRLIGSTGRDRFSVRDAAGEKKDKASNET